ncbi:hypothetical protein BABINDRAFT_17091, partial [Babjeviella inositovora NRRL Y-12698]
VSYPYDEQLTLKPLPANNLLATFEFNLESKPLTSSDEITTYEVFPRALGPIIQSTNTKELHLRFAQGWWDAECWGKLPLDGKHSGGTGVEIWLVIEAESQDVAFSRWIELVNGLSGLFCASLNYINAASTAYPLTSFQPVNQTYVEVGKKYYFLRAALPSEPVCTENLTPFVKLLPTRGKQGVASLLDGHRLFDSQWHSMAIDIETKCDGECVLAMAETISSVIDVPRSLRTNKSRIPHPEKGDALRCDMSKTHNDWQCFPLGEATQVKWDLREIFGKQIIGTSALNAASRVCVDVDPSWKVRAWSEQTVTDFSGCIDVPQTEFNVEFESADSAVVSNFELPPVMVSRSLTGSGQDNGGFRIVLTNPSTHEVSFNYFETLPWFVRVYLHSLKAEVAGKKGNFVRDIYYKPAIDRERPTQLELAVVVPGESTLTITYGFDKSLLLYAEYPPDPNHGFEIEPAVISTREGYQLRTTSLLLTLPLPDFSMPYNVIIMTSTVLALTYGTVFNLIVKRTVLEAEAEAMAKKRGLA